MVEVTFEKKKLPEEFTKETVEAAIRRSREAWACFSGPNHSGTSTKRFQCSTRWSLPREPAPQGESPSTSRLYWSVLRPGGRRPGRS